MGERLKSRLIDMATLLKLAKLAQRELTKRTRDERVEGVISKIVNLLAHDKPLAEAIGFAVAGRKLIYVPDSILNEINALSDRPLHGHSSYLKDRSGAECLWIGMKGERTHLDPVSNVIRRKSLSISYCNASWYCLHLLESPIYQASLVDQHAVSLCEEMYEYYGVSLNPNMHAYSNMPEWHSLLSFLFHNPPVKLSLSNDLLYFANVYHPVTITQHVSNGLNSDSLMLCTYNSDTEWVQFVAPYLYSRRLCVEYSNRYFTLVRLSKWQGILRLFKGSNDRRKKVNNLISNTFEAIRTNRSSDPVFRPEFASNVSSSANMLSSICTAEDIESFEYKSIIQNVLKEQVRYHRKQWEHVFIVKHLQDKARLPGSRGLGFGVGKEPLSSLFASFGSKILATDLPTSSSDSEIWNSTSQYSSSLSDLYIERLINHDEFIRHCTYQPLDMNDFGAIPSSYDFHWSSCVIEHIGSKKAAFSFLVESASRLNPGGLAVHTTELCMQPDNRGIDQPGCCVFTVEDLEVLSLTLEDADIGCRLKPLVISQSAHPLNYHIDTPPYSDDLHLRLLLLGIFVTSVGLIIEKE